MSKSERKKGHGATQCFLVKVYEGPTNGGEQQKKGLNIKRGLRKNVTRLRNQMKR